MNRSTSVWCAFELSSDSAEIRCGRYTVRSPCRTTAAVHEYHVVALHLSGHALVTQDGRWEVAPGDIQLIHVPGKSPGEIAFHVPRSRALIVGDVVIGVPAGELSTYPDNVIQDMEQLHRSAAHLLEYDFDALLLCDGDPIPSGGKQKLQEFVERASA